MLNLIEKYRPKKVSDFVGLQKPRVFLSELAADPKPMGLLFLGPPGTGKTTMAMAFARELGGSLIHIPAQKCTVDAVAQVWADVHYYPPQGNWWVVLIDEADQMSRQAQLALLSHLDSTANLAFDFGGAAREADPLPVVWIFTANGAGDAGILPPAGFEARFLSRVIRLAFPLPAAEVMKPWLRKVWTAEGGNGQLSADEWNSVATTSVREALNSLEMALMDVDAVMEPDLQNNIMGGEENESN